MKRYGRSVEEFLLELDQTREIALNAATPQTSAAVAATMAKAKLLGMITDKVAVTADNSIVSLIREIEAKTVEGD